MEKSEKKIPPEIRHRKLGQHWADGLAWSDENVIEIDSRLTGINHLETLIHEMLHIMYPTWNEIKVDGHAKQMANILWSQNYRKVSL